MRGHPEWCDPQACTIGAPTPGYNAAPQHASTEIVIGAGGESISLRMTQQAGRPPRMAISMPWNHGTQELDARVAQQLHHAIGDLLKLFGPETRRPDA